MDIKEKIYRVLKKNPQGCSIQDVSNRLGLTRNTISVALAELKGAGFVKVREIGRVKLHNLSNKKNIEVLFN